MSLKTAPRLGARVYVGACAVLLLSVATGLPAQTTAQSAAPAATAASAVDPALLELVKYRYIGPSYGGRVSAVAGHRAQPRTFYFGSTGGGVFRSDDAGQTWRNLTDGQIPVGSIGAIEVAPSNPEIIYVATGSAAIRSNVSIGKGVYKSIDGGKTWRAAGLEKAGVIADMVVHPTNPEIAYVAAVGNPFGRNVDRGIFRTRDGGRSWQKVLFVSDSTGASDIALNPQNPNELYAGMWRAERKPWTIISGAREGGIYKSIDGGDKWTKLTNGLPNQLIGKISISIAPSEPRRVYALLEAGDGTLGPPGGVFGGVYRTDDGGSTWTRTSNQSGLINRPFYYTYIDVDPKNADVVYVNNEGFFRSTDGGKSFARVGTPHGDNHGMWINPDDPNVFIQSNDGGANVTLDGGRTWSPQTNQPTAELYQVDLDDRWPYWVYAGQQDRSTIGVPSTGERSRADWRGGIGGCETGPAVPQPGSNGQIFFSACKGRFYRHSAISEQTMEYSVGAANMYGHNPKDLKYRFQRVSPIVVSPHDPNIVYHASQFLHRTEDGGRTWETISPDLTANDPRGQVVSGTPITRDITGEEFYSVIYTVAESPIERGVIWTGANDGPIQITRNNGQSWTNVTPRGLPGGGRVQTVEASPHRRGSAYAAVLRYMFDDWKPYIFRTDDYGASWTLLTGPGSGFPQDHPTRVVREDPEREGLLYAGTEFGAFISFDNGKTWQSFQRNLPATPITDMKVFRRDLVISTQGRGFWIVDNLSPLHEVEKLAQGGAHLLRPRPGYRGGPRGTESIIEYYLPTAVTTPVTLEILDARGTVIRTIASATGPEPPRPAANPMRENREDEDAPGPRGGGAVSSRLTRDKGMNSVTWDLRQDGGLAVLPGRYTARLKVGDAAPLTTQLEVRMHPRLLADGITAEDLQAQYDLAVKVQELTADGRRLAGELRAARERLQGNAAALRQLEALERRVNTQPNQAYAQPMLTSQISYLSGIVRGDNRPHNHAFERYEELKREVDSIRAELQRIGR